MTFRQEGISARELGHYAGSQNERTSAHLFARADDVRAL